MSTAKTLLAYSCPMRWNTRSAPVRSTRTSMPPNFALNEAAIFSATGRSIEVYQTTLPSFLAASINCGVMASAGGAAARSGDANTVPSAAAVDAFRISRLESPGLLVGLFIAILPGLLSAERAAAVRWKMQPDLGAARDGLLRRRDHPQRGAVRRLHHVI